MHTHRIFDSVLTEVSLFRCLEPAKGTRPSYSWARKPHASHYSDCQCAPFSILAALHSCVRDMTQPKVVHRLSSTAKFIHLCHSPHIANALHEVRASEMYGILVSAYRVHRVNQHTFLKCMGFCTPHIAGQSERSRPHTKSKPYTRKQDLL